MWRFYGDYRNRALSIVDPSTAPISAMYNLWLLHDEILAQTSFFEIGNMMDPYGSTISFLVQHAHNLTTAQSRRNDLYPPWPWKTLPRASDQLIYFCWASSLPTSSKLFLSPLSSRRNIMGFFRVEDIDDKSDKSQSESDSNAAFAMLTALLTWQVWKLSSAKSLLDTLQVPRNSSANQLPQHTPHKNSQISHFISEPSSHFNFKALDLSACPSWKLVHDSSRRHPCCLRPAPPVFVEETYRQLVGFFYLHNEAKSGARKGNIPSGNGNWLWSITILISLVLERMIYVTYCIRYVCMSIIIYVYNVCNL